MTLPNKPPHSTNQKKKTAESLPPLAPFYHLPLESGANFLESIHVAVLHNDG
jgi:hypothetical protein